MTLQYLIQNGPDMRTSNVVLRRGQKSCCRSVARAATSSRLGWRERTEPDLRLSHSSSAISV